MTNHKSQIVKKSKKQQEGSLIITIMTITALFIVMLLGAISLALLQQKLNMKKIASTQALHIAEAGVNYYRWVLYHDHEEYCNKEICLNPSNGHPNYGPYGPFDYTDQSGTITGQYELYITPPPTNGSTIVDVKAIGWTTVNSNVKRTIEVQIGIPSWASYSTLCNEFIRFGTGTETWGQIHSNGGIRFDGLSHHIISSSYYTYDDPDHTGAEEFAVHTHIPSQEILPDGNTPPQNLPIRPDIFISGRQLGAPIVSFDLLDAHLANMLTKAASEGIILNNSGTHGYHIIISPIVGENNDSIEIRTVTNEESDCYAGGSWRDTHNITAETFHSTIVTPANGIIYVKDKVWVEGQVDNDRITIVASEDMANDTDLILFKDILYTNPDTDSIGLIAERDILVSLGAEDDLEINAAVIAKSGRVGRNYYNSSGCGTGNIRNKIKIFGSLATKERYGFAYTDGSGYQIRELEYDANLTYAPPPHFPTTDEYTFISWKEN